MLVVPRDADADAGGARPRGTPRRRAARTCSRRRPGPRSRTRSARVADLVGSAGTVAVGDRTWARFVVDLQDAVGDGVGWRRASEVVGPLRARKDPAEVEALTAAAAAADRVAAQLQGGRDRARRTDRGRGVGRPRSPAPGRGPRPGQLRHRGHGPERGQPAPRAGRHRDRAGPGGAVRLRGHLAHRRGRRLLLGHHPLRVDRVAAGGGRRGLRHAPGGPGRGRRRGRRRHRRARRSTPRPARPIAEAGFGDRFIHRTGHGIGVEEHEDPYIVVGNREPLAPRPRLLDRAGHLHPGTLGDAARGHRGGRRTTDPWPSTGPTHDLVVVDG